MVSFRQLLEININGGMYIHRSQMPQIDNHESFIQFLTQKGYEVSLVDDVELSSIKPTQHDIDLEKVAQNDSEKPIFISSDNFILDGHHRYFHKKNFTDKYSIQAYQANTTINKLLKLAYDYLNDGI
jgi:hypothetical protein